MFLLQSQYDLCVIMGHKRRTGAATPVFLRLHYAKSVEVKAMHTKDNRLDV